MALDFSTLEKLAYRGFDSPEPKPHPKAQEQGGGGLQSKFKPFTGIDKRRNYRAMYRAACEYHERHSPPQLTEAYWEAAADDVGEVSKSFDNDPFVMDLLSAIYDELEREYILLRDSAAAQA